MHLSTALTYHAFGDIYLDLADYEKALEHYQKAYHEHLNEYGLEDTDMQLVKENVDRMKELLCQL